MAAPVATTAEATETTAIPAAVAVAAAARVARLSRFIVDYDAFCPLRGLIHGKLMAEKQIPEGNDRKKAKARTIALADSS